MPVKHIDRRIGSADRGNSGGFSRERETFSDYFKPENSDRKVLRYELLGILTQYHKARQNMRWWNRLWRFLKKPIGSGPIPAVEPGDMDTTVKGEPVKRAAE